jgi:hypothetical protein
MRTLTVATLLALVLTHPALAGGLITPPLAVASGDSLACVLQNGGTKDVKNVTIEASDINGVLTTVGPVSSIGPGDAVTLVHDATTFTTKICKFVFKGKKKTTVASACVLPGGTGSCQSIVAAR